MACGAAHVEVHAALFAPRVLDGFAEHGGEFDLFLLCRYWEATCGSVSILRFQGIVQARVGIAEVDGGPHLEVEIGLVLRNRTGTSRLQPANSFAGSR